MPNVSGQLRESATPPSAGQDSESLDRSHEDRRRRVVFRLMHRFSGEVSTADAARLMAEATDELFGWDAFSFEYYDPTSGTIDPVLNVDVVNGRRSEVPATNCGPQPSPLARRVIDHGPELILRDHPDAAVPDAVPFGDTNRRSASLMFVPIRSGAVTLGIISVQSYRPRAFARADLDLLVAIGDLCAGALRRIRAERALQENETRLAYAQSVAGLGSYEVELVSGKVVWSAELFRLWRRDPKLGPMSREEVFATMVPEDARRLRPVFETFVASGEVFAGEYRTLQRDGSVRHLVSKARVLVDELGRRRRIIGAVQDVTDQVVRQQALRESEELLAMSQAIAEVGSYSLNLATGARRWSAETYRLWARDPALGPMQPNEVLAMIHPDDRANFAEAMRRMTSEGEPMEQEFRIVWPDGSVRFLFAKAAVNRDANGRPAIIVGTVQDISQRKLAEQALIEHGARLAEAQQIAGVGSFEFNLRTGQRHWSAETYRIWNRDPRLGPVPIEAMREQVVPEDREPFSEAIQRAISSGESYSQRYRIQWPDGSVRHLQSRGRVARDRDGRPALLSGTVQDITEQQRVENALRLFRAQVDRVDDAIEVLDPDTGKFLDMNERGCRDLGYTREEILMLSVSDIDPRVDLATFLQDMAVLRNTGSRSFESEHRRRDGSTFPVEITLRLVRLDREYLVTVVRNITERRKTETVLRESERIHSLIFNSTRDPMWLIEVQGVDRYVFRSVNDAFELVTGLTRAQVLDRPMDEWFPAGSFELVKAKYREAITTGRPVKYEETTRLPAGVRVGEISVVPILDPAGRCRQLLGNAHDITERKAADEALRASDERYRLLADNSDDFVTLLEVTPAGGYTNAYVSPAYLRRTGWTLDDLRAKDWRTRVHPDDIPVIEKSRAANLAGQPTTLEQRVVCRDGSSFWVELRCKPLTGADGKVAKLLLMARDVTQRRQLEEILRASEERYRGVVQDQTEIICRFREDGTILFANETFCRFFGKSTDEITGTRWHPRVVAEDLPEIEARLRTLSPGNPVVVIENRVHAADGTAHWMQFVNRGFFEPNGRLREVQSVGRDITERKRLEAELRLESNRVRLAAQAAQVGVWEWDPVGGTVVWDDAMYGMYGIRRAESPVDYSVWERSLHPEDRARVVGDVQAALDGKREFSLEFRIVRPDGALRHLQANGIVLRDHAHRPARMIGTNLDITERKQNEEALRLQAAIVMHMSDGVLLTSPEGRIVDCNAAAEQLFGYRREELTGQSPSLVHRPADRPELMNTVRRGVLENGYWRGEFGFVRKDGSEGTCESVCVPLRDGQGTHLATISVNRDVTERQRLKQEILEIGDRERDRIGQDLHDGLCQQLIGVAFAANQLTRPAKGLPARMRAVAKDIAESLDDAITQARQIARGLYPVSLQAGGLPTALQELSAQITQRTNIACEVEADETITVKDPAVATHLFRIAQESLNNAVKHARAARIVIRLQRAPDQFQLSVIDDGVGLPAESRRLRGMGMQILDYRAGAIGARLTFESATGMGTTVTCSGPLSLIA